MQSDLKPYLKRVAAGEILPAEDAAHIFNIIMTGQASDVHLASLLTALALRGPAVSEVTGACTAMRAQMTRVHAPEGAIDLVGTGGDGHGTLNISSAAAFVVAACGVPVAKHGNRNMSSKTGAADVLEALGIKIALSAEAAETCLKEAGIVFLFAQCFHPAMKYVAPVRKALGFRTLFNLLGPLSNPAGVKRQLLGVYDERWLQPVAETLAGLGCESAWVVNGSDGLDEITVTGPTKVAALKNGRIESFTITPEDAGLPHHPLEKLKGGQAPENAQALLRLMDGEPSAYRDIVLMNAAGALINAGKTDNLAEGAKMAAKAIDSGAAKAIVDRLIATSQRL